MWEAIGVVISGLCALGSLYCFCKAQKEKKAAQASEEKARIYAENADAANNSAKEYYDLMITNERPKQTKDKILRYLKLNADRRTTDEISEYMGLRPEETYKTLVEMLRVDKLLVATGNVETINKETKWNPIK